jgi:eukaryotic translation initiation factor 2C
VRANCFAVRLPRDPIFDYAVNITPEPRPRAIKEQIFQLLEQHPTISPHTRFIAHDKIGRIVSARQLDPYQPRLEVEIIHRFEGATPAHPTTYMVEITLIRTLDPRDFTR